MAQDIEVSPVALARLAGRVLCVGDGLTDTAIGAALDLPIPRTAFGNVPGAFALQEAYASAADAAVTMAGLLAEVAESDADGLYFTAFSYQWVDQRIADKTRGLVHRG